MRTVRSLNLVRRLIHVQLKMGAVENDMRQKLAEKFKPFYLQIENESNKHNVPKGSETHFKVVVVSDDFEGLSPIERHRMINDVLKENLKNGVHALSITARTKKQWEVNENVAKSPPCLGGSGL